MVNYKDRKRVAAQLRLIYSAPTEQGARDALVIYTTNMIESINYQLRKITKTRGHFPTDDARSLTR